MMRRQHQLRLVAAALRSICADLDLSVRASTAPGTQVEASDLAEAVSDAQQGLRLAEQALTVLD